MNQNPLTKPHKRTFKVIVSQRAKEQELAQIQSKAEIHDRINRRLTSEERLNNVRFLFHSFEGKVTAKMLTKDAYIQKKQVGVARTRLWPAERVRIAKSLRWD